MSLFSWWKRRHLDENDLDEEIRAHLAIAEEERIADGADPQSAHYAALKEFGNVDLAAEDARRVWTPRWLDALRDQVSDFRYAVRSLSRTPGVTLFVVVTLALGIGMTVTPFSMLDALIFRPYPVPRPRQVVNLVGTTRDSSFEHFSYREYLDIRDRAKSYEGVIANAPLGTVGFSADPGLTPVVRAGMLVSGNYFRVLGVEPTLGRGFREDEDQVPGRDAVVVLTSDFWKRELAGDPGVLGRIVRLNGREFTVIGVAPASFPGMLVFSRPDFYMPLSMAASFSTNPRKDFFVDRDDRVLAVRARLKPGVTLREARNEIAVIARDFAREHPKVSRDRGAAALTQFEIRTRADDVNWKFGVIFTILALAVLLVACTNAAGLLLARARSRKREFAVRLAIGAGRFRLIRLLLTESLVLALLGGLGGVLVAYAGIAALRTFSIPAELPVEIPFRMDARALVASLALSLLSALFCGLAPALQSTRTDLVDGLKSGDVDEPGRRRLSGRNALVVAQIAISLMLLAASFLMFRGFHASLADGLGFAKDGVLMMRFDPRLVQYDAGRTQRFYELLTDRVREEVEVESAGLTQNPPLGLAAFGVLSFVPEGLPLPPDREHFNSAMDTVDEGFFETLAIPVLWGRGFLPSDTADAPRVAVVNEQFAKHYWPGAAAADAVGKRLRLDDRRGEPVEIVGVVETVKYRGTSERPIDFVYLPLAQSPTDRMILMLRTSGDPLELVEPVRKIVRALDANMPALETRTYEDLYRYHAVEGPGVAVRLVGILGAVGLILAVAGLYGLVAYNVSRRTREIGIRMAIGARPGDVLRLMMRKGLRLVGMGTAIGLALGFAVEQLMNSMLFDAGGVDLAVYLIVVPAMVLTTVLAAYVPARKASRIAPTLALRYE